MHGVSCKHGSCSLHEASRRKEEHTVTSPAGKELRSQAWFSKADKDRAGIAVLKGHLAPDGAIIKPSACTAALLVHRGRAVVFKSVEDLHARIDDEQLDIDESCVMVLKGAAPKGYPGFSEFDNMRLPQGVAQGYHRHD